MKIGYITTAANGVCTPSFFEEVKKRIKDNGYSFEEIDIANKTKEQLQKAFDDKNIIHIEGGNTFYLLKTIRETNFEPVLKELLISGKIFIGTSAGAYIMCPSIEVENWNDNGKDRFGVTDFSALNYVPFVLKVHYTDETENIVRKNIQTLQYPLKILRNGQGILVENDIFTFIGDEEVKY